MNLFQIDFIQGKTDAENYGTIVHSLIDIASERQIINLSMSPDKLQSVSCYMREPKRLEFECFSDAWISAYILSGDYEHDRYISHYEVKAYRDDVLIFSGIIDTSNLVNMPSEETVKFLCYDKIKLFAIFSDLQQLYALSAGYQPSQILSYFAQKIEAQIPINLPVSASLFTIPENLIPAPADIADAAQLKTFDISEMCALPSNAGGWVYTWDSASYITPKYGYVKYALANKMVFFLGHKKYIKGTYGDDVSIIYKSRYKAAIMVILSASSILLTEYESNSAWVGDIEDLSSEEDDFISFFTSKGYPSTVLNSLSINTSMNYTQYSCHYTANQVIIPNIWYQWLPSYLHPGKFYETMQDTDLTNCLGTLKAMLLLYNATLRASAAGVVQLCSKELAASTPVEIADADVVAISLQRINPEVPDTSVFSQFAGDSALMQTLAKAYLLSFHALRWQLTATIDQLASYSLELGSTITIKGDNYYLTECQSDWQADDYKVKGWKL